MKGLSLESELFNRWFYIVLPISLKLFENQMNKGFCSKNNDFQELGKYCFYCFIKIW